MVNGESDRHAPQATEAAGEGRGPAAGRAPVRPGAPGAPGGDRLLGLGIDVIAAERIGRLLERQPRAYERLFSPQERAYCDGFSAPHQHYAARFAAKEAVGKALGIGIIGFVWRDIEVVSGGQPRVVLRGGVADAARRLGVTRVELSLSHTAGMAYAVAAALKEDADV